MASVRITTTHLELRHPGEHRPRRTGRSGFEVAPVRPPDPALNHFFFLAVGRPFRWYSRLEWSYADWRRWVERPEVLTGLGRIDGAPCGYFELERQDGGANVELVFFGLLPEFLGRGLGGPLLSAAIDAAWALGPGRVWLHTCSADHPAALSNYRARGFVVFDRVTRDEELPDDDDPRWATPAFYRSAPPGIERGASVAQKYCQQK